jgi:hypothetical protein
METHLNQSNLIHQQAQAMTSTGDLIEDAPAAS